MFLAKVTGSVVATQNVASMTGRTSFAETRTMPTAPRPGAVAMAAIGSFSEASIVKDKGAARPPCFVLGQLNFGKLNCGGTPMRLLISHCCAIDSTLFVIQYSTRPAGK